ncbi:hypothetical protein RJ639_033743 [Escallonia herrerae]|uniref:Uncharacterized protein n=1 Tax=Escallonia herrerae TaxID=1293975 RepID=A0AA88WT39_9ASTE|nr:hypothetical protein RJ639_033743 [Escallonia herrerae]
MKVPFEQVFSEPLFRIALARFFPITAARKLTLKTQHGGGGGAMGEERGGVSGAAAVTEGDVEGREIGRYGTGAGSSDDSRFSVMQQPLNRLAVRLVTQLPSQLEDPGGAQDRHADAPPSAVDLGVAVLGCDLVKKQGENKLEDVEEGSYLDAQQEQTYQGNNKELGNACTLYLSVYAI